MTRVTWDDILNIQFEAIAAERERIIAFVVGLPGECHDASGLGCRSEPCVENVSRASVLAIVSPCKPMDSGYWCYVHESVMDGHKMCDKAVALIQRDAKGVREADGMLAAAPDPAPLAEAVAAERARIYGQLVDRLWGCDADANAVLDIVEDDAAIEGSKE